MFFAMSRASYALFVRGEILFAEDRLAEAGRAHEEALAIRTRVGGTPIQPIRQFDEVVA